MAKSKVQSEPQETEEEIMRRMNDALKRMMEKPHETHKDMVERRRQTSAKRGKANK
jgi:hypothetical protein